MVAVCTRTYVDPSTTVEEQERIQSYYLNALTLVSRALGGLQSERPVAIFCKTGLCSKYFTGPAQRSWVLMPHDHAPGGAYVAGEQTTIVIVRTDARAQAHLAHELVHVELAARIRPQPFGVLPLWFHEGTAASIANEPGNCHGGEKGIEDLRKLDANRDWANYTNLPGKLDPTYCQARAEVTAWIDRHGRQRFFELLELVREGGRFYDAYGPMLTQ
jgi:hypothetical protein